MERIPFLTAWEQTANASQESPGSYKKWPELKRRTCGSYALSAVVVIALTVAFFRAPAFTNGQGHETAVMNSTLGFGAIILLSLPERTDRRDAISLIAAKSDIQITKYIEATHGQDIHPKARPYGRANSTISDGYIGSWRTHMDALKYVVDNRLETALLFEDDVDWDIRIKSQLKAFSQGLKTLPFRNQSSIPISTRHPYGNDWDIMHLGASIIRLAPNPYGALWHPYFDPARPTNPGCSVDETNPLWCWRPVMESLGVPADSRAIVPSHSVTGLPAIAVTLEGAQRILWELSLNRLDFTLDWSLFNLLGQGRIKGWTVLPPLFGMWKTGGSADSDLFEYGTPTESGLDGGSPGIERSARKALIEEFGTVNSQWKSEYWRSRGINLESAPADLPAPDPAHEETYDAAA